VTNCWCASHAACPTQVPKPSFVARMGGDEFVVLFHADPANPAALSAQALAKAEQLRKVMEQPFTLPDNQRVSTTISIGMSLLPNGLVSADDAMREADTAMYQAKGKGRNQVTQFEERMHTALHQRMQLANDLSHALRTNSLSVAVQTQVDAAQQVVGAELPGPLGTPHDGARIARTVHSAGRAQRPDRAARSLSGFPGFREDGRGVTIA
jgi:predicted signal transduction protein with EAL and GGDEF domain